MERLCLFATKKPLVMFGLHLVAACMHVPISMASVKVLKMM
nr:MAG TPA: hypothetical protein [Caudoviricetes sp.]